MGGVCSGSSVASLRPLKFLASWLYFRTRAALCHGICVLTLGDAISVRLQECTAPYCDIECAR